MTATTAPPLTAYELVDAPTLANAGQALADACMYATSTPGKQLRTRLVFEAARLGNPDRPAVVDAARAVELLHLASLAHDDIVDDSALRRGKPSLAAQFGGFSAAYAGGWLFAHAVECAARCGAAALELFVETICALCEGELTETRDLYNSERSARQYLLAIEAKTAALFSACARLGGIAGGAAPAVVEDLGRFGESLGMAFQLADDILDLRGGAATIGKPLGIDLRQGVYTLPVMFALEADDELRGVLAADIAEADLPRIIERIEGSGAVSRALELVDRYRLAAGAIARALDAPWLESFIERALQPLEEARRP
jgi:heptaprenyl diphosphate synthase